MGISYVPSQANFVLFQAGKRALEIRDRLRDAGVLVRDRSYEIAGCVRVTVGTRQQTRAFLEALGNSRANLLAGIPLAYQREEKQWLDEIRRLELRLSQVRPRTLGQASRIDGITPAALTLVLAAIRHSSAAHAVGF